MRILLLILLPIGDTLFTTPAIHALRKRYPDARITAFVYPTNSGILRSNPDIDEFIFWPTRQSWPGFRHLLSLFWSVRKSHFDLAVEFCNYAGWLPALAGIRRRVDMNLPHFWWIVPGAGRQWCKVHAVTHYLGPVERLGIPVKDRRYASTPPMKRKHAPKSGWLNTE